MPALLRKIKEIAVKIVWILIVLTVIWMIIVSGNSSVRINYDEHSYIIKDSIFNQLVISVVVFVAVILFCYCCERFKTRITENDRRKIYTVIRNSILLIIMIMGLVFVVSSQKIPVADQWAIVTYPNYIRSNNFSWLKPDDYLWAKQNQFGVVLILYVLINIFGENNYIAFQILNVISLTVTYFSLSEIVESKYGRKIAVFFLVLCLLFFPPLLYCTFVYGTIWGMMWCSISALFYFSYTESKRTINLWIMGMACFLAICTKQNYIIFVVGLLIWILMDLCENVSIKTIVPVLIVALAIGLGAKLPVLMVEKISSTKICDGGVPSWAYIAMGLQDNEDLYDGWWNRYHDDIYEYAEYNTEKTANLSKEYIRDRIKEFVENPRAGISFFSGKNATQWMNPDYECFWVNWRMLDDNSNLNRSEWVEVLNSLHTSEKLYGFLNVVQFIVFLCTAFFVFLEKKNHLTLYFAVIFLGGVIFHTFWEAKSQYTLPYFMYLMPLASIGLVKTADRSVRILERAGKIKNFYDIRSSINIRRFIVVFCAFMILVLIQSKKIGVINVFFAFDQYDETGYKRFYNKYTSIPYEDKKYNIINLASELIISEKDGSLVMTSEVTDLDNFEIENRGDWTYIKYSDADNCLDVPGGIAEEGKNVWLYPGNNSLSQRWRIVDAGDGAVYVLFRGDENYVLTSDLGDGHLYLSRRDDLDNQKWIIK